MKPEINRTNYEAYLLDYLEGSLDDQTHQAVEDFLANHPDIAAEITGIDQAILPADNKAAMDKNQLIREVSDLLPEGFENMDEFLVAAIEDDLTTEQSEQLSFIIDSDEATENEYKYLQYTRIEADKSIVYADKNKLKKKAGLIIEIPQFVRYSLAAAAAMLVFLTFVFKFVDFRTRITPLSATNNSEEQTEIKTGINETGVMNQEVLKSNMAGLAAPIAFKEIQNAFTPKKETASLIKDDKLAGISHSMILQIDSTKKNNNLEVIVENKNSQPAAVALQQGGLWIEYEQNTKTYTSDNVKPLNAYLNEKLREDLLRKEDPGQKVTFWDVASAGVKGVASLFGKEYDLKPKYREDGKVSQLAFSSPAVNFNIPVNKNNE